MGCWVQGHCCASFGGFRIRSGDGLLVDFRCSSVKFRGVVREWDLIVLEFNGKLVVTADKADTGVYKCISRKRHSGEI